MNSCTLGRSATAAPARRLLNRRAERLHQVLYFGYERTFRSGRLPLGGHGALYERTQEGREEIINAFNAENVISSTVYLNHPGVWIFDADSSYSGQRFLCEPFIEGFQKFNSNSGIVPRADDTGGWPALMQALSHFSYHNTGGRYVLCDLQGGVWPDGGGAVLTDPVILSRDREFGPTDLGSAGISTFFARHTCNKFCQGHWHKPKDQSVYFEANEGTTFM
eukprot:gene24658-10284_t